MRSATLAPAPTAVANLVLSAPVPPPPVDPTQSACKITTVAGGGTGDGIQAESTSLFAPVGLAMDAWGNLYIADAGNHRVRRVDGLSGIVTTVAGNGSQGFSTDGLAATQSSLNQPFAVAIDPDQNIYIADQANQRVRKVDAATGVITTIAGSGVWGYSGDGDVATKARLHAPVDVVLDHDGNLLIVDQDNNRVRRLDVITGIITTVVGTGEAGFSGDGGLATSASLSQPEGLAVDKAGNYYLAESRNHRVRRIDSVTGVISTVAGTGTAAFSGDAGLATQVELNSPRDVAVDAAGNVFIADMENHRVRRVDPATGIITTVAGTGAQGFSGDGFAATLAMLNWPKDVAVDTAGNLSFAERLGSRVRRVDAATGIISTAVGTGIPVFSGDGGQSTEARLNFPFSVAADGSGNLFITDTVNHQIRRVDSATGTIKAVAGTGIPGYSGDGKSSTQSFLHFPMAVTLDASGNLFIADSGNNRVRRVDVDTGTITTVAGTGRTGFSGDGGLAAEASLDSPSDVAVDAEGNLFIADTGNHRVRMVDNTTGIISTVAGAGVPGSSAGDVARAEFSLNGPGGLAVDTAGDLFIADSNNHRVLRVDSSTGVITLVAGTGTAGFSGDYGAAAEAMLNHPQGIALDGIGNLYIADVDNHRIRVVDAGTAIINTVVGNDSRGFSEEEVFTALAKLNAPTDVAVDADGGLLVADMANGRIRKVDLTPRAQDLILSCAQTDPDSTPGSASIGGRDYFVSTKGSDGAPGSEAQPWRSLQHAAYVVAPGDTVFVRSGVYDEGSTLFIEKSGVPGAYITFKNYPDEVPIIVNTSNGNGIELTARQGTTSIEWVWIEGIEVRNARNCLRWRNAANIRLISLNLHHCSYNGILGTGGDRVDIEYSKIHHNGHREPDYKGHGLYLTGNRYPIVNNLIYSNMKYGIQAAGYTTATFPYLLRENEGTSDWLISNNVIAFEQNRGGIILWRPATKNIVIQNNIFYGNDILRGGFNGAGGLGSGGGHIIANNLFFGKGQAIRLDPELYTELDNMVDVDPLFLDPLAYDFRLKAESPAIDAGLFIDIAKDLDGNKRIRGSAIDIGPYEHLNSSSNRPPIAAFSMAPFSGTSPLAVDFDASASTDKVGHIERYEWDFGDGSEGDLGPTVRHIYMAGTYTPILTVIDDQGAASIATGNLNVLSRKDPQKIYIVVEAESGLLDPVVRSVVDDLASADAYIESPVRQGKFHDGATSGGATYSVEIPVTGTYRVWGYVATPHGNRFYVEADRSGDRIPWKIPEDTGWAWHLVSDDRNSEPLFLMWETGRHTLEFNVQENGAQLDKLLITNDLSFLPHGY